MILKLKMGVMSQAVLDAQASFVTPEAEARGLRRLRQSLSQSPAGDDDVERNADFYTFSTMNMNMKSLSVLMFQCINYAAAWVNVGLVVYSSSSRSAIAIH